jgi:hypothetical protein
MRGILVALGVLIAAAVAREAAACSCSGLSSCEIYGRADAVFVGDVVAIDKTAGPRRTTVQMRVVRTGKGAVEASRIVTVGAPSEDSSCGMGLEVGQRWMVFAKVTAGSLVMNPCAGSHRLGLDERLPDLPPRGGTIHGRLLGPWSSSENERRGLRTRQSGSIRRRDALRRERRPVACSH